jgi:NAD(P)-dependent dehydrogenase (short-subunit alcohol dehydrogenase family)
LNLQRARGINFHDFSLALEFPWRHRSAGEAATQAGVLEQFAWVLRPAAAIEIGGRSGGRTRIIFPGSGAYASMKGAIEILALYLAKELGPRRIAVNTVAPGAIATDFSGGMVRDNPEVNKVVAGMTALGRAGVPDDIGPMIASLLSDDNRWVNAQRIEVSGGMSI